VIPAGLVLIDSYLPSGDAMAAVFSILMGRLLELDHEAIAIDDDHLITMGAYMRLLSEWQPGAIEAPTLMLRASEGHVLARAQDVDLPAWQLPEITVDVAGDHFDLIADSAAASAEAIETWLRAQIDPQPVADQAARP
jgi:hypothetical protein